MPISTRPTLHILLGMIDFRFELIIILHLASFFFTPALADDLSLESEEQQVSSGLQNSFQFSDRS